ncbi:hypothetical protein EZ449_17525 [Pedobacter frigidisoli]|uniref:Uncharacterized protein n=1 Tax=Pedobacter frigidisoli TaxID=2530455 RepID=A0A4R0NTX3_9SPHI|nr:hypothetical protein [Pedobacter frigidisoli]TCD04436.1 hypothetical protein EZ449_17525 [Pedobacter frigidisoli]
MSEENNDNQSPKNLINIITFNVRATKTIGDNGLIPWINIANANEEILNLIDKDEIVISENEITIVIDYPLTNPASLSLISETGFSREKLLIEIRTKYIEIFEEEEKAIAINDGKGKYGIWGHSLYDLDLVSLDVYKTDLGKIEITLDIDS